MSHVVDPPPSVATGRWSHRFRVLLSRWEFTPKRITILYLVFGFAALFGSDVLLAQFVEDPLLGRLQTLKGGVEVVLTAVLVFALSRASEFQYEAVKAKLERQREELSVLHRVLRHNLRNDLNVIQSSVELLEDGPTGEDVSVRYATILATVERVLNYVDQAQRIRKVTEKNGSVATFDLGTLVPEVVETHPLVGEDVDVTVNVPESAEVLGNRMFAEALTELVTNAVAHNDSDTPNLTVEVDPAAAAPWVTEIRVRDNGPGITEYERRALEATETDQLVHLEGMGLWFVTWTVRHSGDPYGGDIRIEPNEDGLGSTVRIQLPKRPVGPFA